MNILAENRRAQFDYNILETFEAGLALIGQEVKSIRAGHMNLTGSYALFREGELWLVNAQVPPWQPKNAPADYDPARSRKLLLTARELRTLTGKLKEKGLSLVPLKAYSAHNLIKLTLGLGRSRKKSDKRELIKKRETEREVKRTYNL